MEVTAERIAWIDQNGADIVEFARKRFRELAKHADAAAEDVGHVPEDVRAALDAVARAAEVAHNAAQDVAAALDRAQGVGDE